MDWPLARAPPKGATASSLDCSCGRWMEQSTQSAKETSSGGLSSTPAKAGTEAPCIARAIP